MYLPRMSENGCLYISRRTCAMDAVAKGVSSMDTNSSPTGVLSSRSTNRFTCGNGLDFMASCVLVSTCRLTGQSRACSLASSDTHSGGMTSLRDERFWPTLTQKPLGTCKVSCKHKGSTCQISMMAWQTRLARRVWARLHMRSLSSLLGLNLRSYQRRNQNVASTCRCELYWKRRADKPAQ